MNPTSVLAAILVIAFGLLGSAKLVASPAMRSRAEHAGFSVAAYRRIGALEISAVLGLLLGGAVIVHLRNRDGVREMAPAVVLGVVAFAFVVLVLARLS